MTSNGVTILEPPYRDLVALVGRLPALGSIAVVRIDGQQGVPPQLAELLDRAPWTVPCIVIAAAAAKAAANRSRPTAAHFVAYVVRRTNSVVLGQTLDQIWGRRSALAGGNAERTVRYRLRRQGTFSRHDWIRVHSLLRVKTEAAAHTVEQQAHAVGTEARTLRSWVARYLGMTMKTFRATFGWEWILELALARGGVQTETDATPPWSAEPTRQRGQPVPY